MSETKKKSPAGKKKKAPAESSAVLPRVPLTLKDLTENVQAYIPDCIRILACIARDEDAANRDRITAIKELLDRAYGKASQPVDANLNTRSTLVVAPEKFSSVEEWEKYVKQQKS